MSHGDRVTALPPGFRIVGTSPGAPFAAVADEKRGFYAVQFHPEVVHTPDGARLLANFVHKIAGLKGDWSMAAFSRSRRWPPTAAGSARQGYLRSVGGVDSSSQRFCA